jgi:hypothetical protein
VSNNPVEYKDHFSLELSQWIDAEVLHAFSNCRSQFQSAKHKFQMPHVYVHHGYGGEARHSKLMLCLSPDLNINSMMQQDIDRLADARRLIHHEMVHVFQHQLLGIEHSFALATWFSEGMAVAFSGQPVIFRATDVKEVLGSFGQVEEPQTYLLMSEYRSYDMKQSPFSDLYGLWGTLFLYSVAQGPHLHAGYHKDDGPYLSAEEMQRAINVVLDTPSVGFDTAFHKHTGKPLLSLNSLEELIGGFTA